MVVANVRFDKGMLIVTDEHGNDKSLQVVRHLAQVVTAIFRILIETQVIDGEDLLTDDNDNQVTVQQILSSLTDYYGAEFGDEGKGLVDTLP